MSLERIRAETCLSFPVVEVRYRGIRKTERPNRHLLVWSSKDTKEIQFSARFLDSAYSETTTKPHSMKTGFVILRQTNHSGIERLQPITLLGRAFCDWMTDPRASDARVESKPRSQRSSVRSHFKFQCQRTYLWSESDRGIILSLISKSALQSTTFVSPCNDIFLISRR